MSRVCCAWCRYWFDRVTGFRSTVLSTDSEYDVASHGICNHCAKTLTGE